MNTTILFYLLEKAILVRRYWESVRTVLNPLPLDSRLPYSFNE